MCVCVFVRIQLMLRNRAASGAAGSLLDQRVVRSGGAPLAQRGLPVAFGGRGAPRRQLGPRGVRHALDLVRLRRHGVGYFGPVRRPVGWGGALLGGAASVHGAPAGQCTCARGSGSMHSAMYGAGAGQVLMRRTGAVSVEHARPRSAGRPIGRPTHRSTVRPFDRGRPPGRRPDRPPPLV